MKASWLLVAVCFGGCKKDHSEEPIDGGDWVKAHGAVARAFKTSLDAAVELGKDLPMASAHVADPIGGLSLMPPENALYVSGVDVPGMEEYGQDAGKDPSQWAVSILDWKNADVSVGDVYAMLGGRPPDHTKTVADGEALAARLAAAKYVVLLHQEEWHAAKIDDASHTFVPGTYEGVAEVIALDGPHLLGTVAIRAKSSDKVATTTGVSAFSLHTDLDDQAAKAFRAEWPKVFPAIALPPTVR